MKRATIDGQNLRSPLRERPEQRQTRRRRERKTERNRANSILHSPPLCLSCCCFSLAGDDEEINGIGERKPKKKRRLNKETEIFSILLSPDNAFESVRLMCSCVPCGNLQVPCFNITVYIKFNVHTQMHGTGPVGKQKKNCI